jgi:hypothetical protein
MPKYLLQYRVQTCLTSKANVDLSFEGHNGTFLFSQKHANDTTVLVQMELDSANNGSTTTGWGRSKEWLGSLESIGARYEKPWEMRFHGSERSTRGVSQE